MLALTAAADHRGSWRLNDCTMYVTLEPCAMCAGALVLSRVARLVFGTCDPKAGACVTLYTIPTDPRLNHRIEVAYAVLEHECAGLLTDFFAAQRAKGKK
jgi:tRNA(adenine34) deaminase